MVFLVLSWFFLFFIFCLVFRSFFWFWCICCVFLFSVLFFVGVWVFWVRFDAADMRVMVVFLFCCFLSAVSCFCFLVVYL